RVLMPGHPDTPERLVAIEAAMAERDWLGCERRQAPPASEADLELVHSRRLVASIRELCATGGGEIDADTVVGEPSFEAARHAAGGAREMARALLAGEDAAGFCCVRPSGHHAEADRAMGFCLFNNVAVAAETAIRELGCERVMILDWDVHHGNGTAEIFRRRPDVLFCSIHQSSLYPGSGPIADLGSGEGEGYTINLPVPPGSGEELWLSLVEHIVVPIGAEFKPDLILISAGFDAHREDPLAGCDLEASSFAQMACHLRELARELGVPLGAVQEGGYHLGSLVESLLATIAALGGEGEAVSAAPEMVITSRAATHVAPYWHL
ncbi:MAG: histone deacetylase, partial [Solirubrobacterales bacterium]